MECILDRAGSHNEIQGKLNTLMFLFIYYTYVMKIEELSYQAEYVISIYYSPVSLIF